MAATDIIALFFDQEEIPMALLFGPGTIDPGRRCAISSQAICKLLCGNARKEPISIENLSFPEIEAAIEFKARGESSNAFWDSQQEHINLKAQYDSAGEVEKQEVLQLNIDQRADVHV